MPNDELVFVQGPVMTEAHCEAMRQVVRLWPYPDVFERGLLDDVLRHLLALNGSAVAVRSNVQTFKRSNVAETPGFLDDWRVVWKPLTVEECYDCDQ